MTKRDRAKLVLMNQCRKKLIRMMQDTMDRKGIGFPELAALAGIPDDRPTLEVAVKKLSCAGMVRVMFELGYELSITPVPLSRDRLKELSEGGCGHG